MDSNQGPSNPPPSPPIAPASDAANTPAPMTPPAPPPSSEKEAPKITKLAKESIAEAKKTLEESSKAIAATNDAVEKIVEMEKKQSALFILRAEYYEKNKKEIEGSKAKFEETEKKISDLKVAMAKAELENNKVEAEKSRLAIEAYEKNIDAQKKAYEDSVKELDKFDDLIEENAKGVVETIRGLAENEKAYTEKEFSENTEKAKKEAESIVAEAQKEAEREKKRADKDADASKEKAENEAKRISENEKAKAEGDLVKSIEDTVQKTVVPAQRISKLSEAIEHLQEQQSGNVMKAMVGDFGQKITEAMQGTGKMGAGTGSSFLASGSGNLSDFFREAMSPSIKALEEMTGISKEGQVLFRELLDKKIQDFKASNPAATEADVAEERVKILKDEEKLKKEYEKKHQETINKYEEARRTKDYTKLDKYNQIVEKFTSKGMDKAKAEEKAAEKVKSHVDKFLKTSDQDVKAISQLTSESMTAMAASTQLGREAQEDSLIRAFGRSMKKSLSETFAPMSPVFTGISKTLGAMGKAFSFVSNIVGNIYNFVNKIKDFIPLIILIVGLIFIFRKQIADFLVRLPGMILDGIKSLWGWLTDTFPKWIGQAADYMYNMLGDWWGGVFDSIGNMLYDAMVGIFGKDTADTIVGFLKWIKKLFEKVYEGALGLLGFDVGKSDEQNLQEGRDAAAKGGGASNVAIQDQLRSINAGRKQKGLSLLTYNDFQEARQKMGSDLTVKEFAKGVDSGTITLGSGVGANPTSPSLNAASSQNLGTASQVRQMAATTQGAAPAPIVMASNQTVNNDSIQAYGSARNDAPTSQYLAAASLPGRA